MNGISPTSATLSRIVNTYNTKLESSLRRISTGLRVERPSDDLGNYFRARELTRRSTTAESVGRELQDHASRLATAETALTTMSDLMDKMSELARKASNEDSASVRASLGKEYDALVDALDTVVNTTRYKGELLLTGLLDTAAGGAGITAQVDEEATDRFTYQILDSRATQATGLALTRNAETDWGDAGGGQANALLYYQDTAENDSGMKRIERNLSRVSTNLTVINASKDSMATRTTNYAAASSALVGVDQAAETSRYASMQIQQQAAASFLAQSNMSQTSIISLLAHISNR